MTGGPPDFIIGGAPRCGTTYLHAQMSQHPDICMAVTKEPWYFVEAPEPTGVLKVLGVRTQGYHHRGRKWYEAQFAHCSQRRRKCGRPGIPFANSDRWV